MTAYRFDWIRLAVNITIAGFAIYGIDVLLKELSK